MSQFLDLPGASGARYRFRRAELDALPVMGGNLVVAQPHPSGPRLFWCAPAESLAQARPAAAAALKGRAGAAVYVRLNVARATREAEHADLTAAAEALAEPA